MPAVMRSEASGLTSQFYLFMMITCAAVAVLGFAPTYFLPLGRGAFRANPVIHVHAAVFFGWCLFLVWQTWLATSGRVMRHRSVGMIGISIATAMVIFGTQAAVNSMKLAAAVNMREQGIAFAIVPLSGIVFFAIVFALGIGAVRRPEVHKRLMLLATISILDAPIARWFIVALAPADAVGPPPVGVTIPPALVAALLVVAAMAYDWRTRGRPHDVYVWGLAALLAVKLLNQPLSTTAAWQAIAGGMLALAQ